MVKPASNGKGKGMAVGTDARFLETTHTAYWDAKSRYPLPAQMSLDSGWDGLMAEIKNSDGESNEAVLARISAILEELGDEELTSKVEASLAMRQEDSVMLARVLNRVTTISQERSVQ
jgi:hypothetical protein